MHRSGASTLAVALGLLFSPAALAQAPEAGPPETPEVSADVSRDQALETIVVTATRRTTDLQETPVAVTAVTGEFIAERALPDVGAISRFVPNFSAARQSGFNAASFAMRGVGQSAIIVYFEPPVAVVMDDFVISSVQTQLLDTFDIEQVEVLRGPQGTLFGKNTTGGAVVVRTRRPQLGETGFEARLLGGSFGTVQGRAAINHPLLDTLALRLVGSYVRSDGYMRNGASYGPITAPAPSPFDGLSGTGPGNRVGGQEVFNGRAKLLWEPSSDFSALLQYEILRDRSDTPATVNENPVGDLSYVLNRLGLTQSSGDPLDRGGVTNRRGYFQDQDKGQVVDVDGGYLNVNWDVGPGTLTSVTGYRRQFSGLPTALSGQPPIVSPGGEAFSFFDIRRDDLRKTFQQEIRFASELDGPLNFVAGGFYQRESIDFCVAQVFGYLDLLGSSTPYGPFNTNPYLLCNGQRSRSWALFAEANYNVTDQLTLTAGFRYTWDRKKWQGRQQVFTQQLLGPDTTYVDLGPLLNAADFERYPNGVITDIKRWSDPTYRLSASYQFTPDIYGYATFSRGFKSGAYNDQIGTFAVYGADLEGFRQAAQPTNPEYATSYEVGLRTDLLDRRLRLNLTGFYVEYDDLQRRIVIPITVNGAPNQVTTYFNAAAAHVQGLEAEATLVPARGLTLRAILGYQDGQYDQYVAPIPPGYDLSTSPLDRTPRWQWGLDAAYDIFLAGGSTLTFQSSLSHTSRNLYVQAITRPEDNVFLEARTLLDASITFHGPDDRYFARLVGRNLTDERYNEAGSNVGGLFASSTWGPPRFLGVEVGVRIGR